MADNLSIYPEAEVLNATAHTLKRQDGIVAAYKRSQRVSPQQIALIEREQTLRKAVIAEGEKAKKIFIPESCSTVAERTRDNLDIEEVLGQLKHKLPFDRLWIEGAVPQIIRDLHGMELVARFGATLVQEGDTVVFTPVTVAYISQIQMQYAVMGGAQQYYQNRQGEGLHCDSRPARIVLSPEKGIVLDEDAILQAMENFKTTQRNIQELGVKTVIDDVDPTVIIDKFYYLADHMARLLMVMKASCKDPESLQLTPGDKEEIRRKQARTRMSGLLPNYELRPIITDITRLRLLSEATNVKRLRVLLGWTDVRRSIPIVSKHGKVYTRGPHERRIPSPVDRRAAARIFMASQRHAIIGIELNRPVWRCEAVEPEAPIPG